MELAVLRQIDLKNRNVLFPFLGVKCILSLSLSLSLSPRARAYNRFSHYCPYCPSPITALTPLLPLLLFRPYLCSSSFNFFFFFLFCTTHLTRLFKASPAGGGGYLLITENLTPPLLRTKSYERFCLSPLRLEKFRISPCMLRMLLETLPDSFLHP